MKQANISTGHTVCFQVKQRSYPEAKDEVEKSKANPEGVPLTPSDRKRDSAFEPAPDPNVAEKQHSCKHNAATTTKVTPKGAPSQPSLKKIRHHTPSCGLPFKAFIFAALLLVVAWFGLPLLGSAVASSTPALVVNEKHAAVISSTTVVDTNDAAVVNVGGVFRSCGVSAAVVNLDREFQSSFDIVAAVAELDREFGALNASMCDANAHAIISELAEVDFKLQGLGGAGGTPRNVARAEPVHLLFLYVESFLAALYDSSMVKPGLFYRQKGGHTLDPAVGKKVREGDDRSDDAGEGAFYGTSTSNVDTS